MDTEFREQINTLIRDIASGDSQALELLYYRVGGRMLSIARSYTRDTELAQDIVQDSFLKIYKYSAKFKRNDNGYGWICTIVRNTALNALKREKIRVTVNIDELFFLSDDAAVDAFTETDVRDALRTLDATEREVIWYRYFQDMTVRDIAQAMGKPRSTISDLIQRAQEKLKKKLE